MSQPQGGKPYWDSVTRTLGSWEEFNRELGDRGIGGVSLASYVFRGQVNSMWTLKPSLCRVLDEAAIRNHVAAYSVELKALLAFQSQAHLWVAPGMLPQRDDHLAWLALMQHYRAPTRLLDWTLSPYVGVYFAVAEQWDRDGVLWAVPTVFFPTGPYDRSRECADMMPDEPSQRELYLVRWLFGQTDRMAAQQGCFTISNDPLADHADLIPALRHEAEARGWLKPFANRQPFRLIVPAKQKPAFLGHLHLMNVSARALYPGIEGLGRHAYEQARLASEQVPSGLRADRGMVMANAGRAGSGNQPEAHPE